MPNHTSDLSLELLLCEEEWIERQNRVRQAEAALFHAQQEEQRAEMRYQLIKEFKKEFPALFA